MSIERELRPTDFSSAIDRRWSTAAERALDFSHVRLDTMPSYVSFSASYSLHKTQGRAISREPLVQIDVVWALGTRNRP